jgi:hypothetical protein
LKGSSQSLSARTPFLFLAVTSGNG